MFRKRGALGDTFHGVFFGGEEAGSVLEQFVQDEAVTFTGVVYKKDRAGKVTTQKCEMPVDVKSHSSVSMGERALIEALSED
jgi:hypothetical protein